jgi:hypothetical protein
MSPRAYLLALSKLAAEVGNNLRLLPSFISILRLIPSTVRALVRREADRLAA